MKKLNKLALAVVVGFWTLLGLFMWQPILLLVVIGILMVVFISAGIYKFVVEEVL